MPTVPTYPKGLVFISCGQVTLAEKQLGKDVCALVEKLTPYIGYFAENQGSLEALTKYILANLDKAIGLIAIMHPRGSVTYTDETGERHEHVRASVWIEQEIAIAAYITQLLGREINILCYAHRDIILKREGMRAYLPLNPIPFTDGAEIISDLTDRLPRWKPTPRPSSSPEVPGKYDRRLLIYKATRQFVSDVLKNLRPDLQVIFKFNADTDEALFLFDDGLAEYLKTLFKNAGRLNTLDVLRERIQTNADEAEQFAALLQEGKDLAEWFAEQPEEIRARFAPFLRLA